ncbi:hypothetical protein N7510_010257 [Penicillium lagena]|uniref:uncharacterized protein n=1 Tax=Penicillium lagena TaxID=94218 RepID=UPI002540CA81|nr:uncharacterized protein N7510_010257 [Penicillium lagena]KAJ5605103.1 hypothetical protein N7510_010257 [Penicillium lagena]
MSHWTIQIKPPTLQLAKIPAFKQSCGNSGLLNSSAAGEDSMVYMAALEPRFKPDWPDLSDLLYTVMTRNVSARAALSKAEPQSSVPPGQSSIQGNKCSDKTDNPVTP